MSPTPKEKAKEIVDKFYHLFSVELENTICVEEAKECALLNVDELLKHMTLHFGFIGFTSLTYWNEVKEEIKKL